MNWDGTGGDLRTIHNTWLSRFSKALQDISTRVAHSKKGTRIRLATAVPKDLLEVRAQISELKGKERRAARLSEKKLSRQWRAKLALMSR